MSGADYRECDRCEGKAYYDTDTDYGDALVWVLCEECAKTHRFRLIELPNGNEH